FTTLKVYDILGREVATLLNENMSSGSHDISFDGSNLSSGIYIYRLSSKGTTITRRMTLIK
ncbi:MAG: T9SS type A sorting domain-containing protein, partial [Balneola sp.]